MKRLKVINYKYVFLYLLLLVVSVVFFFNYSFLSIYLANTSTFFSVDKIKFSHSVSFLSGTKLNTLVLDYPDDFNILVLNKEFDKAKKEFLQRKTYSYKDFFNLANLYFLKSYDLLKSDKTGYVENLQKSLSYYQNSLKIAPSYSVKYPIVHNLDLSNNMLSFAYVYFCDNLFVKMIKKTKDLLSKLDSLLIILKQQNKVLNKWSYYSDLKSCINGLKNDSDKNIALVYENKSFFSRVRNGLIYQLVDYVNKESICYQKKDYINEKYAKSINSSFDYFEKFYKLQKNLLTVYEKADYMQMKLLCENKSKIASNQSKMNKQMEKNFQNLSDLANKPKPHRKKKSNSEQNKQAGNKPKKEEGQGKKQDDKNKKDTSMKKEFKDFTEQMLKNLEEQNKTTIDKIMKERSQFDDNPQKYIDNIFKQFYGNDDYYKFKKQQTIGK